MEQKKIIVEEYRDPTGMRVMVDDRGNYHCFMDNTPEIKVIVENRGDDHEAKRFKRILEALRRENNWLWEILETARRDRKKKGAVYAMQQLEKAIEERTR